MKIRNVLKSMVVLFIFISAISFVYSLLYSDRLCGSLFCYFLDAGGTTTLTNDNQPIHTIIVESAVDYTPDLTKTYFERGTNKEVQGDEFNMYPKSLGKYKKQWFFDFTASPKYFSTGSYSFHTVFYNPHSPSDTVSYSYTYLIDRTPPTIGEIKLLENGVTDKSNTKIIEENNNATIKVKTNDNDGIADTGVTDVWVCVDEYPCETTYKYNPDPDGFYSFDIANLQLGGHTVYFYAQDNLTNLNDSVIYRFSVSDTTAPGISFVSPIGGMTNLEYPTLVFETSEDATCKLYRYETGDLKAETTTLQREHNFSGFPIDLPTPDQLNDPISRFNISCKDAYDNENSLIVGITYTARLPLIKSLRSTKGDYITTYSAGKITSLEVTTNTNTVCWYKGGKKPQDQPIGATPLEKIQKMISFGTSLGQIHTKDLTTAIEQTPGGLVNTTYSYYVICREEATSRYTDLGSIDFTVSLQLDILNTEPSAVIYDANPNLFINLSRRAYCRYKRDVSGQWIRLGAQQEFEYTIPIGPLDYGSYSYDVECSLTDFTYPDLVSTSIDFLVVPELTAPVLWELPKYTNKNSVDVIGYTNQDNVNVYIGVFDLDTGEDVYLTSTHIGYSSLFKGQYFVGSKYNENTINVDKGIYDALLIGDYIEFSGHKGQYFKRYRVVSKSTAIQAIFGIMRIRFDRDFASSVGDGETFYVYDAEYPEGWFNVSVNLKVNTQNSIRVFAGYMEVQGESTLTSIFYDTLPPVISLQYPTGVISNNKTEIKAKIEDNSKADPDSLIMNIDGPCYIENLGYPIANGLTFVDNIVIFEIENNRWACENGEYLKGVYAVTLTASDMAGNENSTAWSFEISPFVSTRPDFKIEGESLEIDDVWYTSESLPNIILDFSEDTVLNDYSLMTATGKYNLNSLPLEEKRIFELVPGRDLGEAKYKLKLNVTGTKPGSVPTIFYFDIVVDKTGPEFTNINVPSQFEYNIGGVIQLKVRDQVGVNNVAVKVGDDYYNMSRYDDIYNISTNEFLPIVPPFKYNVSFYAYDNLHNLGSLINYKEIVFVDSTPPKITVLEPETGYTNVALNTIKIKTDDPSYCNFSWNSQFLQGRVFSFTSADMVTHAYVIDLASKDSKWNRNNPKTFNYYIKCTNMFGLSTGILPMQIVVDTSNLEIIGVIASKPTYYIDNYENTITVNTNKPAKCRYSDNLIGDYHDLDYNISTDFSVSASITKDFMNGEHRLYIDCKDKADNTAVNPSWFNFTVNVEEPFMFVDWGPRDKIADKTPRLWAKLNREGICEFDGHLSDGSYSLVEYGREVYVKYYDIGVEQSDGSYNYEVECWDDEQNHIYENIIFTINTTPPNAPVVGMPVDDSYVKDELVISGTTDDEVEKVIVYINGEEAASFDVINGEYSGVIDLSGYDDGTYTIEVKAQFPQGEEFRSEPTVRTIIKDTVSEAPTLKDEGILEVIGTNKVAITGEAEPNSEVLIYIMDVSGADGINIKNTTSDSNGDFTVVVDILEGENYVYTKIIDEQGNEISDKSNEVFIYYDNKGPEITNIIPNTNQNKVPIEIRAHIEDYSAVMDVYLTINDSPVYTYDFLPDELGFKKGGVLHLYSPTKNGTHLITITAEDEFGNQNKAEQQFLFDTDIPARPQFNLDGKIINDSSPELRFVFEDEVTLHSLKIGLVEYPVLEDSNTEFLFNAVGLDDNSYGVGMVASKIGGAGSRGVYNFEFTIDVIPPIIKIDPSVPDFVGLPPVVNISGDCSDIHWSNESWLYVDGSPVWRINCTAGRYKEQVQLGASDGSQDGPKNIGVTASDLAGNTNSDSKVIELDTGYPQVSPQDIINNDDITFDPAISTYKTNDGFVTIIGSFDDDNFEDISVVLNGKLLVSPNMSIDYAAKTFELNLTLDGKQGEEFENNITLIVRDSSGLETRKDITIIKDLKGPQIVEFEPKTYTTADLKPTINITTHEEALGCWINYTAKTTGQAVTNKFNTSDKIHLTVTLSERIDYNEDNSSKTQDIVVYCVDKFSNFANHTYKFTVDRNKPLIEDFSVYYGIQAGIIVLVSSYERKEYALIVFDVQDDTATNILLKAKTNEDTICGYSGSFSGVFKGSYSKSHETNNILIYDGQKYIFDIKCEDKGGLKSEVKRIEIEANSSFESGRPIISATYPDTKTIPIISSLSVAFMGRIIPPPGYSITQSNLFIDNQTYDLGKGGVYSQSVDMPDDGNYLYSISAYSNNGKSQIVTSEIIIDTTGPGGCVKVGNITICRSIAAGRGRTTETDLEPDFDKDELPDDFEYKYWDCIDCAEPDGDDDNDGLTNLEEYKRGEIPVIEIPKGPHGIIKVG